MKDFHGIIFAYSAAPELRELVTHRTAASMPIFGRYRVIDFSLSSLMNAGIHDVGVIMQRDYQSLMDHIRNGKSWDMSRKDGGVRLLPPFGMPGYHSGNYFAREPRVSCLNPGKPSRDLLQHVSRPDSPTMAREQ